jgi:hypothetical protein
VSGRRQRKWKIIISSTSTIEAQEFSNHMFLFRCSSAASAGRSMEQTARSLQVLNES